ncbi:MAG: BMC domain-containing protein [Clostridiales Family XIII bacterium]|jgi:microcompartment protein CcmL/EutN|nr:BMC domain-containing protein [Clostridiales Family XIII bacterium]
MRSIGFLELSSIVKGIEAADAVIKASDVALVFARPTCPGKYGILFSGDVAAVKAAMEAGEAVGSFAVADSAVIPRIHPQVLEALWQSAVPSAPAALGLMEFFSIAAAIRAADAAVKSAAVELLDLRLGVGVGGKSFVALSGEVAAVAEAVRRGVAAEGGGLLVAEAVLPNPAPELYESLL